jgi:glycosyltransferase involved in cell wall biosynthesis
MTRVAYVTARYPFGAGEAFLGPEARELARRADRLTVIPTRPSRQVLHEDARSLLSSTIAVGLVSAPTVCALARRGGRNVPQTVARIRASRSAGVLCKNLAVTPKAAWLARTLDRLDVGHVHVHWGGTSSTMAMLACEQVGVPWSLTVHRWDIDEDNLLAEKVESAAFVRAISHFGAERLRERVPAASPDVVHMGVDVPAVPAPRRGVRGRLHLLAVGSLTPQNGHLVLLAAMRLVGPGVTLDVVGDGPLRSTLASELCDPPLRDRVRLLGQLPHTRLLERLSAGEWDALVHPSPAGNGLDEGIPVALMEAMAAGLPVIAFPSGGVPELISPGTGLLIAGADAEQLANGITELADDPERADALAAGGIARIRAEFDAAHIAEQLAARFDGEPRP